jgi:hypothetical protein
MVLGFTTVSVFSILSLSHVNFYYINTEMLISVAGSNTAKSRNFICCECGVLCWE